MSQQNLTISEQIAQETGLFKSRDGYLRPDSNESAKQICDSLHKSPEPSSSIYVRSCNLPEKIAITIGGSDFTLSQFASAFNKDLDSIIRQRKTAWAKSQPKRAATLESWAESRKIPTKNLSECNVTLGKRIKADGTTAVHDYLFFVYPDGSTHYISTTKQKTTGNYIQGWQDRKGRASLWAPGPMLHLSDSEVLYIAEGEKDALSIFLSGLPVLALYSASGLSGAGADWLLKSIPSLFANLQTIRICFDCDEAGRTGALRSADNIRRSSFFPGYTLEILQWPEGTAPKTDLGDLVAQHGVRTKEVLPLLKYLTDFELHAAETIPHDDSKDESTPTETIIPERLERRYNGYYIYEEIREETTQRQISNCVFNISRKYYSLENGTEYLATLSSPQETSRPFRFSGDIFSDLKSVKKLCLKQGRFYFNDCINYFPTAIFMYETGKEGILYVEEIDGYGWDKKNQFYAFPTLIVSEGKCHIPEGDSDLIRIDNKSFSVNVDFPIIGGKHPEYFDEKLDISTFSRHLIESSARIIGKPDEYPGLLILGWMLATYYSDLFFTNAKQRKMFAAGFPLLQIYGAQESGKTETLSRFYELSGISADSGSAYRDSTNNYFAKCLYALRGLPMWFDEARSEGRISADAIKSAYNHSSPGKGTIKGTSNFTCNGSLILSGEQPVDQTHNRSILIGMPHASERNTENRMAFDWFSEHRQQLNTFGLWVMKTRTEDLTKKNEHYLWAVSAWRERLRLFGLTDRLMHNYAAAIAGLYLLPEAPQSVERFLNIGDGTFADWFKSYIDRQQITLKESDPIEEGITLYLNDYRNAVYQKGMSFYIPCDIVNFLNKISGFDVKRFLTALKTAPYYQSTAGIRLPRPDLTPETWENGELYSSASVTMSRKAYSLDASHLNVPAVIDDFAIRYGGDKWLQKTTI